MSTWTAVTAAFVIGALAAAVALQPALRLLERFQIVDVPNYRSSHTGTVPRGGGIAVMAGATFAVLVLASQLDRLAVVVVVVAGLFAVVGFLDDLRNRSPRKRLAAQALLATAGVAGVTVALPAPTWWFPALGVAAVLFVMGFVNAFNFMDGVNGISGFTALVASATFGVVAIHEDATSLGVLALAIGGGMAGFLPSNVPTAKVFLGDSGSYGVGSWLALCAVASLFVTGSVLVAVAPCTIYVADTSWTLVRRVRRGANVLNSHREHVYQRLTDLGWSHVRSAAYAASLAGVCAALGIGAFLVGGTGVQALAAAGMVLVAAVYLSTPTWLASRSHQAADAG